MAAFRAGTMVEVTVETTAHREGQPRRFKPGAEARVVLPTEGGYAVVEFPDAVGARRGAVDWGGDPDARARARSGWFADVPAVHLTKPTRRRLPIG